MLFISKKILIPIVLCPLVICTICFPLFKERSNLPELICEIKVPTDNYLVRANVPIYGDAGGTLFRSFRLEYGKGSAPQEWIVINESKHPTTFKYDPEIFDEKDDSVLFGNLGTWETGLNEFQYGEHPIDLQGFYTLRLTVVGEDGTELEDTSFVEVGQVVLNAFGGTIWSQDKVFSIAIPEHSLSDSALVASVQEESSYPHVSDSYSFIGKPYSVRPPGEDFLSPVEIRWDIPAEVDLKKDGDRLGIYTYDYTIKKYVYVPTQIKDKKAIAPISRFPEPHTTFALLMKTKAPTPPLRISYDRYLAEQQQLIVRGLTEPHYAVDVSVNGDFRKSVQSESDGTFEIQGIYLLERDNALTLRVKDEYEVYSDHSPPLHVTNSAQPVRISVVNLLDKYFGQKRSLVCTVGDALHLEAKGIDPDPKKINTALIRVVSESDPRGILLELYETNESSGIFRGIATVSTETDQDQRVIKARNHLESLSVKSIRGEALLDIVYSDSIPPRAPQVIHNSSGALFSYDFENDHEGIQRTHAEYGARLEIVQDEYRSDNQVLRLTNPQNWGTFSASLWTETFDVQSYPFLSFRYRMPPDVSMGLYLKNEEGWFEINLNGNIKEYQRIGIRPLISKPLLIADGAWHHVTLNLLELLRNRSNDLFVSELLLADWDEVAYGKLRYGATLKGDAYFIDDVRLSGPIPKNSVVFDVASDEDTVETVVSLYRGSDRVVEERYSTLPQLRWTDLRDGSYTLCMKGRDAAHNWSRTSRYSFLIDTTPPFLAKPFMEAAYDSGLTPMLSVLLSDANGSGIDPRTIVISIDGVEYGYYDTVFTLTDSRLFIDPSRLRSVTSDLVLKTMRDYAGNTMREPCVMNIDESVLQLLSQQSNVTLFTHEYEKDGAWHAAILWKSDDRFPAGYSYAFNENPVYEPDDTLEGAFQSVTYSDLKRDTDYYFHIKAQNRWRYFGPTLRQRIRVSAEDMTEKSIHSWISFGKETPSLLPYAYEISKGEEGTPHALEVKIDKDKAALCLAYGIKHHETIFFEYNKDHFSERRFGAVEIVYSGMNEFVDVRFSLVTLEGATPYISLSDYTTGTEAHVKKALIPLSAFGEAYNTQYVKGVKFSFRNLSEEKINDLFFIRRITYRDDYLPIRIDDFERASFMQYRNAQIWVNSLGGKLFRFSDGFTKINTEHMREGTNGYYRISYSGVTVNGPEGATYCGWQTQFPELNLTGYNALTFRIRGKKGGEKPNIYLCNRDNAVHIDIERYCNITTEWQTVYIPLLAFKGAELDLRAITEMRVIFEWGVMNGYVDIDDIRFESHAFPSEPVIHRAAWTDGRVGIEGISPGSASVLLRVGYEGFNEFREYTCDIENEGFVFNVPFVYGGSFHFSLQSIDAEGKRSFITEYKNIFGVQRDSGLSILEDFDGSSAARVWWDVDGPTVYTRYLRAEDSNYYQRIDVQKSRTFAWSFFAMALRQDGCANNFSGKTKLQIRLRGIVPQKLLVKCEDSSGGEVQLFYVTGAASVENEWLHCLYTLPKSKDFDFTQVKNILFFAYPGESAISATFDIDDIALL
jgi:hypothetical protein